MATEVTVKESELKANQRAIVLLLHELGIKLITTAEDSVFIQANNGDTLTVRMGE